MTTPRLIRAPEVCLRFGMNRPQLARLRRLGVIPGPLPGTRLYDAEAITRALDALGGPGATIASEEREMLAEAKRWEGSA